MVNSVTEHLKPFQWKEQYEHSETECGGQNQEAAQPSMLGMYGYGVDDLVEAGMNTFRTHCTLYWRDRNCSNP